MLEYVSDPVLETEALGVLLPDVLIRGVVSHRRDIASQTGYGFLPWRSLAKPQRSYQSDYDFARYVFYFLAVLCAIRGIRSQLETYYFSDQRSGMIADQFLENDLRFSFAGRINKWKQQVIKPLFCCFPVHGLETSAIDEGVQRRQIIS
jgi:hypothetical protein